MKRKLIFLDIDGTLTPPGSNVPPDSALKAIRAAQANGHRVFLCSGRNLGMLAPVLALGFEGAVASAGGYVFVGGRVLYDCPMTKAQQDTAMRLLRENGVIRTVEARDASWSDEDVAEFFAQVGDMNSEMERIHRQIAERLNIRPMSQYDGSPIYKIVFMCRDEGQLAPARKALESEFNFVLWTPSRNGVINGEMINRRFDKGRGVRLVAEALGVDLTDTIGFGDSMNDLEMIETVGISVCMENGSPAVKARSAMVCPAVTEDGLAWAFEKLNLTNG